MNSIDFLKCTFLVLLTLWMSSCEYQPYSQGESLYKFYCSSCHMEDGTGLKSLIPPLADSDFLKDHQAQLPCIIRNGIKGSITVNGKVYETEMAGIPTLNDVQINNILNFINHAWGNDFGISNVKEVSKKLEECDI